MNRTMQYRWPGWRNIRQDDTGKPASVNLDMVAHNCVVWRYLVTNQNVESIRIPQTDGNYTLPTGSNDIISGDVFTEYDIDYLGNPADKQEEIQITLNRVQPSSSGINQDHSRPPSSWRRSWNRLTELWSHLRRHRQH